MNDCFLSTGGRLEGMGTKHRWEDGRFVRMGRKEVGDDFWMFSMVPAKRFDLNYFWRLHFLFNPSILFAEKNQTIVFTEAGIYIIMNLPGSFCNQRRPDYRHDKKPLIIVDKKESSMFKICAIYGLQVDKL